MIGVGIKEIINRNLIINRFELGPATHIAWPQALTCAYIDGDLVPPYFSLIFKFKPQHGFVGLMFSRS